MGMYTALSLGVELRKDVPENVVDILKYMVGDAEYPPVVTDGVNDHDFFRCNRWDYLLRCDSYYFDWQTKFRLYEDRLHGNDQPAMWYLTGVSNLKNYDGEINQFLDWIVPYLETREFLGWTMYEEQLSPDLIYNFAGKIYEISTDKEAEALWRTATSL